MRPPDPTRASRRILVVDDNEDSAESLALLIQCLGDEVRTARDGPAALDAVSRFRPSLAFLDIGLPGMSGYELARRIRALPEGRDVTLVAVTGWGQPEARERALDAGFRELVVKPMDVAVLERILGEGRKTGPDA
ncbi:MAG TPA: response regulator [Myxococcota bacterium]|jgi:CheY-like chemotaxis protein|nr:response regulator [Myxococcota bacterium]